MVDEAILDVSDFAQRHPGGRRLILNSLGTDVTQELVKQDQSVGHAMSFSPHVHTGVSSTVELTCSVWLTSGLEGDPPEWGSALNFGVMLLPLSR